MTASIVPVVLAGGSGTRLWPVSRDAMPKQFLPFDGERSTYQQTLLRVSSGEFAPPIVITGPNLRFHAKRQAEEVGVNATIVVEPARRDSGPAIAAASAIAARENPDATVLALAADHIVQDNDAFRMTCAASRTAADRGNIVTFGIKPHEPKTCYGYILPGEVIDEHGVSRVRRFIEKPDAENAARYVRDGFLWNSGNFLFRAERMAEEIKQLAPELALTVTAAVANSRLDNGFRRLDEKAFAATPPVSIDYAVMEKTEHAAVINGNFGWSDIGSWDALSEVIEADDHGNIVRGAGMSVDSKGCIIHAGDRLVAAVGVNDLVIVNTADAVMVIPRKRAQDVRDLVARLKAAKRPEASVHRRTERPWGYYETIDAGPRFQVKHIVVAPGAALSLQKHEHRAEHWVVVRGAADVTISDSRRTVHENESVFIPIGSVHRLANPGMTPLELIEVQTGSYLGEDDIVRFDDVYRRD